MSKPAWILTKLGSTGIPVVCSNRHPEYKTESYDVQIGQPCFEKNFRSGNIIDISHAIGLTSGWQIFTFKDIYNQMLNEQK